MERHDVHELTPAYALDAVDDHDAAAYEAHLSVCAACRAELAALQDTAAALAHGADAADPSPDLRDRILARARDERTNVVPLRSRRAFHAAASRRDASSARQRAHVARCASYARSSVSSSACRA